MSHYAPLMDPWKLLTDFVTANQAATTIVGLILAFMGVFYARKSVWRPNVELTWSITAITMPSQQLQIVATDGGIVHNPHFLKVELVQRGHKDLTTENFAKPLNLSISGATVRSVAYDISGPSCPPPRVRWGPESIEMKQSVLHRGNVVSFEVVTAGRPIVRIPNPLQHATFRIKNPGQEGRLERWAFGLAIFSTIAYGVWVAMTAASNLSPFLRDFLQYASISQMLTLIGWSLLAGAVFYEIVFMLFMAAFMALFYAASWLYNRRG